MNTVKDMVSNNKQVTFVFYRSGELGYETETGFQFPIPISDVGDAVFAAKEQNIGKVKLAVLAGGL